MIIMNDLHIMVINYTIFMPLLSIPAAIRAVCDGGIDELYAVTWDEIDDYLPHFISGDFDSANPKLLELYREKVRICPSHEGQCGLSVKVLGLMICTS
jgi:thiamine pyrophosphokinase